MKKTLGRWGGIPAEKRSSHMRLLAKKKQASLTEKQKRDHALKMVRAREAKRKLINKK